MSDVRNRYPAHLTCTYCDRWIRLPGESFVSVDDGVAHERCVPIE